MALLKRDSAGDFNGFTGKGIFTFFLLPFLVLYGLIAIFSSLRVVNVGEVGVVTHFGQVTGEVQSGLHVIPPWPLGYDISNINIQTQKDNVQAGAATKDLQQLDTNVNFNFHLTPASVDTIFRKVGVGYDSTIIRPAIQEAVKANTAQYNADEEITNRSQVEAKIFTDLQAKLAPWGITADNFSILDFGFSGQFNDAIEKKQVAQQQALQANYDLQTAQLKAQQQQVQAATLTPQYLQLQAINKWDGKLPNTLAGGGTVFNIPLQGN